MDLLGIHPSDRRALPCLVVRSMVGMSHDSLSHALHGRNNKYHVLPGVCVRCVTQRNTTQQTTIVDRSIGRWESKKSDEVHNSDDDDDDDDDDIAYLRFEGSTHALRQVCNATRRDATQCVNSNRSSSSSSGVA
mmetsp:Transcript_1333/g.2777  ORF Transcript_1333/g.2777 Transcript_1333/m.2777 type:complete len:134 (+) Transcript_1333:76-477(+)